MNAHVSYMMAHQYSAELRHAGEQARLAREARGKLPDASDPERECPAPTKNSSRRDRG